MAPQCNFALALLMHGSVRGIAMVAKHAGLTPVTRARVQDYASEHSVASTVSGSDIGGGTSSAELVVAVCTENVSWIDEAASAYTNVTVYDKCHDVRQTDLQSFKASNLRVQRLRNVGSCDFAYLTYIVDRWDSLPDIVEFTKGSPATERYRNYGNAPLQCKPCDGTCRAWRKDNVRQESPSFGAIGGGGGPTADWQPEDLFEVSLDGHDFENNGFHFPFYKSGYENMGAWMDHASTVSPLSRQMYTDACCARNYGGHFAVQREQIINHAYFQGRSRELYVWLRDQQHYANEEVDHFIERTWWSLFCAANPKS